MDTHDLRASCAIRHMASVSLLPSSPYPRLQVFHHKRKRILTTPRTSSISISLIYAVAAKTNWLSKDPMLWFCLMLMPTGPPAMKLISLADVNGSNDGEKMAIAKFLTVRLPPFNIYNSTIHCSRGWWDLLTKVRGCRLRIRSHR